MEDDPIETTTTPPDSPVEETPPPVAKPEETHDNTRELIAELTGKVDALTQTVAGILSNGGTDDSSPVKPPWTHRKVF